MPAETKGSVYKVRGGSSLFALLLARALRDIEHDSPLLGRVTRSAIANYNAEMARISSIEEDRSMPVETKRSDAPG